MDRLQVDIWDISAAEKFRSSLKTLQLFCEPEDLQLHLHLGRMTPTSSWKSSRWNPKPHASPKPNPNQQYNPNPKQLCNV